MNKTNLYFFVVLLFSSIFVGSQPALLEEITGGWDDDVRNEIKDNIVSLVANLQSEIATVENSFAKKIEDIDFRKLSATDLKRLFKVFDRYHQFSEQCHKYILLHGELFFEALAMAYDEDPDSNESKWGDAMERDAQKVRFSLQKLFQSKFCASEELREVYRDKFDILHGPLWKDMTKGLDELNDKIEDLEKNLLRPTLSPTSLSKRPSSPPVVTLNRTVNFVADENQTKKEDLLQRLNKDIRPLRVEATKIAVDENGLVYTFKGKVKLSIGENSAVYFLCEANDAAQDLVSLDLTQMLIEGSGALNVYTRDNKKVATIFKNSFKFHFGEGMKALEEGIQQVQTRIQERAKTYGEIGEASLEDIPQELREDLKGKIPDVSKHQATSSLIDLRDRIKKDFEQGLVMSFDLRKSSFNEFLSEIEISGAPIQIFSLTLSQKEIIVTGSIFFEVESVGFNAELTSLTISEKGIEGTSLAHIKELSLACCKIEDLYFDFMVKINNGKLGILVRQVRGRVEISDVGGLILENLSFTKDGKLDGIVIGCKFPPSMKISLIPPFPIFLRGVFGGIKGIVEPPIEFRAGAMIEIGDSSLVAIDHLELIIKFGKDPSITAKATKIKILKEPLKSVTTLHFSKKGFTGKSKVNFNFGIGDGDMNVVLALLANGDYFAIVDAEYQIGKEFRKKLQADIKNKIQNKCKLIPSNVLNGVVEQMPNFTANLKGMLRKGPFAKIDATGEVTVLVTCRLRWAISYEDNKFKVTPSISLDTKQLEKVGREFLAKKMQEEIKKNLEKATKAAQKFASRAKSFAKKLKSPF
ncbi:hypothetical protein [Candidatus Uabimicrobium amorphum]|uniref:Uncharacterized protein n=1 Tax=Uabimicrobium amorphum TaxID=2596890 RepID=A0A5S9IQC4_UABAM|nr:hypothetical protein [Candidatus Uabimicrobium amorphum]BBM86148.1 hypothetical protein UABAM_04534 [Candidatus Uabimicrobium amorphum]